MLDHDIVKQLRRIVGPDFHAVFEADRCVRLDLTEPTFPHYGLLRQASRAQRREAMELICRLDALRALNLRRSVLRELPDSIANLTQMEELGLGSNYLGQVPPGLAAMRRLRVLGMSNCDLTTVPDFLAGR